MFMRFNILKNKKNIGINVVSRRSAGAAERDGLENRCGGNSTQGSNPCSSAILFFNLVTLVRILIESSSSENLASE